MPTNNLTQEVKIAVIAPSAVARMNEPLTCGIPFPQGSLFNETLLLLKDPDDQICPLQCRVLDRWTDGSIRWLLLDWQATFQGVVTYRLSSLLNIVTPSSSLGFSQCPITSDYLVRNEASEFRLSTGNQESQLAYISRQTTDQPASHVQFQVIDEDNRKYTPSIQTCVCEEQGPLRTSVRLNGKLRNTTDVLADLIIRLHFFARSSTIRIELTLLNSRKAEHPGGLWDLGNGGSIYIRDAALSLIAKSSDSPWTGQLSPEPGKSIPFHSSCELYQDSSGGENWKSSNHINRHGRVPCQFRGYRLRIDDQETTGLRAQPTIQIQAGGQTLGIAVPHFWQNFPMSLEAGTGKLTWHMLPSQSADSHEIQGGEQKTYTAYLAFEQDRITETPMAWCQAPSHAMADPQWYADSGVIPYLTPRRNDPHADYQSLTDAALDGNDTFATKREVIDQYGWRNFGDIYGDHEAILSKEPTPLVSHYNNQYDAVGGLGYQYLRSGDPRWLSEMRHLAQHVIDIDIYHTDQDKSAYNHGLFWHTFHYVDAHTGTHRSYPRDARVPPHGHPVPGGGPANEQNYTTGLMLHYFLTGHQASREAAIGLAQWIIDMDDGNKTIFRWLCRSDTGLASKSRTAYYHGPGRGAANSIAALLDGHRLTGQRRFLDKAEQLIRRCIHPNDRVERHNLLDAENRWFYTMFLQSLGRYLHYKQELGEVDSQYAYARASLLHYVRWMAEHEYPYLEKPEILEYPTETWAAQDMRKCEIFNMASLYADENETRQFREKADYFFRYSTSKLLTMPTRTFCRPVVLMLSFGFAHAWFKQHPNAKASTPPHVTDFGSPTAFTPQKDIAIKRAKLIVAVGGILFCIAIATLAYWLLR